MKSFNPWPKALGGLGVIIVSGLTLLVRQIPIIWIGGFIFGASLAINGFRQWSKIKKLDNLYGSKYAVPAKPAKEELKDDAKYVVVNCGLCFHQYRVRKAQGIIITKCPNCGREARIST